MRSIYSPQRRKERKGSISFCFPVRAPENKKNQLYKVNLIVRATMFITYVKLKLFSEKVLFYSLPFSQRQRIRKNVSASFVSLLLPGLYSKTFKLTR